MISEGSYDSYENWSNSWWHFLFELLNYIILLKYQYWLCLGKGIPPGTGRSTLLMLLNFVTALSENDSERIIQTDSWTDSLVWSSLNRIESKEWIIQTDSWTDSLVWSSLWTELTQNNESFKLIHEPIHWFDQVWTELTQNNESFKLIREPIHWFDRVFEQNWLKIMNHSNWFMNRFTGLIKSLNRIDSK